MAEEAKKDTEAGLGGGQEVRKPSGGTSALRWLLLAALVVALLLIIRIRPEATTLVGQKLSVLDIVPLTGGARPVSLKDLAGKVTVVNFWATWCRPCQMELPEIAELENKLRGQADVRVLAISCVPPEPGRAAETTRELLESMRIDMPTYADPGETTQRALTRLAGSGSFGYPTTIVLDQEGVIRAVWRGYEPGAVGQMEEIIGKLRK